MKSLNLILGLVLVVAEVNSAAAEPMPGTKPLTKEGDLAAQMVGGIETYLDHELASTPATRSRLWHQDFSSPDAYQRSVAMNRQHLRRILGVIDERLRFSEPALVFTTGNPALVADMPGYRVFSVRWPVLVGVDAEGLLLEPKSAPRACVVALPDADGTPETMAGIGPSTTVESQCARRLVESGCRVLMPTLIDRKATWSGNPRIFMTNQPHREFIYRMSYQLGRHITGYEVQKVLAAIDWFQQKNKRVPVGVLGYGEGGLLALYSAAIDSRIDVTVVSGYFGPREKLWREPIYRNVWSLLREFGDAELAMLVAPRALIIEASKGPEIAGPPMPLAGRSWAAPGAIHAVPLDAVRSEVARAENCYKNLHASERLKLLAPASGQAGTDETIKAFMGAFGNGVALKPAGPPPGDARKAFDPSERLHRQFNQLVEYNQRLLRESEQRRAEFWAKADNSSLEKYQAALPFYRNYFWEEITGKLAAPTLPACPRTRLSYDEPRWKGYEVTLDLLPKVFAYGILLVPKDLKPGERRPVVVCQHGLEGRPQIVVDPKMIGSIYRSFGAQLADRGFIVYAPQNPYIFDNRFRQLQRRANPLKLSIFSFILAQHDRTLEWLSELPFVDAARIGFYGLSYGGETAMRVPPILPRYALSICSGDFNQFTWKTLTLDFSASYMLVNTYEIFDFNLGNTYSHAELAAMMVPRPFMVERGHDDGVGLDEWVAYEYAKVRRLYTKLAIPDRTTIEFFNRGHEIHGQGTFAFLEKHLGRPK